MKRHGGFAGSVGVLVLVLSVGLILLTDSASYGSGTKSWDTNNPSATRFVVLAAFANTAVLDKNTGLVWEQAPDATNRTWASSTVYCVRKNVGGTLGWRLPSVIELKSVQDPSLPQPFVPTSVFTSVQSARYWSAASDAGNPSNAWFVDFDFFGGVSSVGKTSFNLAWCVRGGMNADAY